MKCTITKDQVLDIPVYGAMYGYGFTKVELDYKDIETLLEDRTPEQLYRWMQTLFTRFPPPCR